MTKLIEHAAKLAETFPHGGPVYLRKMAEVLWPDASWLHAKVNRHNGGARRGARVAGAVAGKLEKLGYLKMEPTTPRNYTVLVHKIHEALKEARR